MSILQIVLLRKKSWQIKQNLKPDNAIETLFLRGTIISKKLKIKEKEKEKEED